MHAASSKFIWIPKCWLFKILWYINSVLPIALYNTSTGVVQFWNLEYSYILTFFGSLYSSYQLKDLRIFFSCWFKSLMFRLVRSILKVIHYVRTSCWSTYFFKYYSTVGRMIYVIIFSPDALWLLYNVRDRIIFVNLMSYIFRW